MFMIFADELANLLALGQAATLPLFDNKSVNQFMMGGIAIGYAIAALFFLRFWVKTHDRLFVMFSVAFALLGLIRVAIFSLGQPDENHFLYWFRFMAYMLILLAIIDKNRSK